MKYALWIAQIALAVAFLGAGLSKVFVPAADLAAQQPSMAWALDLPGWLLIFIGIAEAAGAIGVVLPAALRIQPQLTPLAALGLAVTMVLAAGFHILRGEFGLIVPNLVLLAVSLFVWYGRTKILPIAPKGEELPPAATA